jgi:murein DD-endopeptidase MepM/ murein hydrolase activator NlpD
VNHNWIVLVRAAQSPFFSFAIALLFLAVVVIFNSQPASIDVEEKAETKLTQNDDITVTPPTTTALVEPSVIAPAPTPEIVVPWQEYKIRRGDTMGEILQKIGIDDESRVFFLSQKLKSYQRLRVGRSLKYKSDTTGRLLALLYKTSPDYYLIAERGDDGVWQVEEKPPQITINKKLKGGRIESSLFAAADRAGVADAAIDLLIEGLESQVDFYRDARGGDTFRVIYEEKHDEDGDFVGVSNLLAFEYVNLRNPNKPRVVRGAWNADERGYFSPDGESLRGAFLRAPLKFRRISSKFTNRRYHPVLKRWRAHRGVDYAARTGTPIRSTADGTIVKVATERGYGKVIMIKHFNIYTTVYGHMSRFAKGMRKGRKVAQGEIIGYVGQTGLSTGPHLHYEFRVHGKHKDPLSTAIPRRRPPLEGKALTHFQNASAQLFAELKTITP